MGRLVCREASLFRALPLCPRAESEPLLTSTTRRGRVVGATALAFAASALLATGVASCSMTHGSAAGTGGSAGVASTVTGAGAGAGGASVGGPPPVTSPVSRPPVAGVDGDRYVRNATPGATCPSAGAIGFTTKVQPVHCSTTAADPHLRWRAP